MPLILPVTQPYTLLEKDAACLGQTAEKKTVVLDTEDIYRRLQAEKSFSHNFTAKKGHRLCKEKKKRDHFLKAKLSL